eukprot:UN27701
MIKLITPCFFNVLAPHQNYLPKIICVCNFKLQLSFTGSFRLTTLISFFTNKSNS